MYIYWIRGFLGGRSMYCGGWMFTLP